MPTITSSECQVQVFTQPTADFARRPARSLSYAPSITSVISSSSTLLPEAHQQRGFKSREAYLAALEEFADGHLHMPTGDHTLKGFYGDKTMDFYKAKSSPREDRKKRREQEARENERRRTLSAIHEDITRTGQNGGLTQRGPERSNCHANAAGTSNSEAVQQERRRSRLGKLFSDGGRRRGTVA